MICGYFTSIAGTSPSINSLAKIYYNGTTTTIDSSFSFPINGEVRGAYLANAEDPHCDIIFWGSFSLTSDSTTFYNLPRLTWKGSAYAVDTFFPVIFNQGGYVRTVTIFGSYLSGYVLVGGFNMQVNPLVGGDATKAYHLIRLNSNFSYDSLYSRPLSRPGGCVTGIGIYGGNQPRIYGTLPQGDGSYHWYEALASDAVAVQKSLGTSTTSGTNYGPIDGPIYSLAQVSSGGPYSSSEASRTPSAWP